MTQQPHYSRRAPRLGWQKNSSELRFSWPTAIFFGAFHGISILSIFCFSWSALGILVLLHWLLGSVGICLTYHRLLTHRSFQVPSWLEYGLVTIGAMALQGGPIFWVAGHRQHHLYTEDSQRDPYAASKGFWWSHMMWLFFQRASVFDYKQYHRFAPDLARNGYYRWLDRNSLILQVPLAVVLYALGGWSFIIYGIFLRSVLLWHSTWLINSATHLVGARQFNAPDGSRNLWWAALLTYGEGWHNNHHAFPNAAQAGLRWWQVDVTWWLIQGLSRCGLADRIIHREPAAMEELTLR